MRNETTYSTDQILKSLERGKELPETQEWAEDAGAADRTRLAEDIERKFGTRFRFSSAAALSPAHLSEFLKGKKRISRDGLLRIFLCLGYDLKTAGRMLLHINGEALYVRSRRDYLIADSIHKGLSLFDTDERLSAEGLPPLTPDAQGL